MHFKLNTKLAKKLVALIDRVADARSTMPILGAICMTVQPDERVVLRATDLDVDLRITLKSNTTPREGTTLAPCNNIVKLLRKTKSANVTFSSASDNNDMLLQANNADFRLEGFVPDDYPNWTDDNFTVCADVSYYGLKRIIMQTEHAASFDDARPHLSAMLFEMTEDEELLCAAMDGHRMASATTDIEAFANAPYVGNVLASRYAIVRLINVFKAFPDCEQCTVMFSDKFLHVNMTLGEGSDVENVWVKLKLQDAKFPPYEHVINNDAPDWSLIVQRGALQEATDTLSVVADCLRIHGIGDTLMLGAHGNDMDGSQKVEGRRVKARSSKPVAKTVQDQDEPTGVSNKYILDVMKAWVDDQDIQVRLYGPHNQIQLRGLTTQALAVIMPMRL